MYIYIYSTEAQCNYQQGLFDIVLPPDLPKTIYSNELWTTTQVTWPAASLYHRRRCWWCFSGHIRTIEDLKIETHLLGSLGSFLKTKWFHWHFPAHLLEQQNLAGSKPLCILKVNQKNHSWTWSPQCRTIQLQVASFEPHELVHSNYHKPW